MIDVPIISRNMRVSLFYVTQEPTVGGCARITLERKHQHNTKTEWENNVSLQDDVCFLLSKTTRFSEFLLNEFIFIDTRKQCAVHCIVSAMKVR